MPLDYGHLLTGNSLDKILKPLQKSSTGQLLVSSLLSYLRFSRNMTKHPSLLVIPEERDLSSRDTWHQEIRPWLLNPTCGFWQVYLGHTETPQAQHRVNRDLTGCYRQYKRFLKTGKWFGQPFSPLKALRTFLLPAGCVERLFKQLTRYSKHRTAPSKAVASATQWPLWQYHTGRQYLPA